MRTGDGAMMSCSHHVSPEMAAKKAADRVPTIGFRIAGHEIPKSRRVRADYLRNDARIVRGVHVLWMRGEQFDREILTQRRQHAILHAIEADRVPHQWPTACRATTFVLVDRIKYVACAV